MKYAVAYEIANAMKYATAYRIYFISLSALAENFIIRRIISYFSSGKYFIKYTPD